MHEPSADRSGRSRRLLLIATSRLIVLLAMGCAPALPSRAASAFPGECAACDSATVRTHLLDGRTVTVDQRALVERDAGYLLLGDKTLVDTGPPLGLGQVNDARAIGALLDRRGVATLVPAPPGIRYFENPKILRADVGGADVLWIDPDSTGTQLPRRSRLMTARFDGKSWGPVAMVADIPRLHEISQPTTFPGGVAVAITEAGPNWALFIEVLIEQNGIWSRRRVLPEAHTPLYPFLLARGSSWYLMFVGWDSADGNGLFIVRSNDAGSTWSSPYMVTAGSAYDPQLFTLGQGLALVWIGNHPRFGPRGVHLAFSGDGTHWTASSLFDAVNDSTIAATAIALDGNRLALVRLIGESFEHTESLEIVSRTGREDILWTRQLEALDPGLLIQDRTGAITLMTLGVTGNVSSPTPDPTLWMGRVRCE